MIMIVRDAANQIASVMLLVVNWIGQWGANANRFRADCGPACVAMLLEFYAKRHGWTVDQLANQTRLADGASGLMPSQLVALCTLHGLPTKVATVTEDDIRAEITAGRPVIALVAYRFITGRLDQGDKNPGSDGHFIVLVGFDETHFVANDPDYWVPFTSRGHDTLIPYTQVGQAMDAYGNQAVLVETDKMSISDQITALTHSIRNELDQLDVLAAQAGTPPTPPPTPPPTVVSATVMEDATHVRAQPTINSAIVDTLNAGIALMVKDSGVNADSHHWMQITNGPVKDINGFIAKDLLTF